MAKQEAIVTVINPDGSRGQIKPEGRDGKPTLQQMQSAVGGYIEQLDFTIPGVTVWVNENGMMEGLRVNRLGLEEARKYASKRGMHHEAVLGPVLIVDNRKRA